ncbi:MAG: NADH-quinone oxidoreductase subunit C, partial [Moorea sp. SIO1F2]|nr:NADH-quinone oxidoreductase subunit C [Moorena sp. SIO1F2]
MAEESKPVEQTTEVSEIVEAGKVSGWLKENGFEHEFMELDHLGVEVLKVEPDVLLPIA